MKGFTCLNQRLSTGLQIEFISWQRRYAMVIGQDMLKVFTIVLNYVFVLDGRNLYSFNQYWIIS
jgi:hypothetical protein